MNELITALATNGIGLVCAAAVLWFAWYRETKTIPTLMATFTASLADIQKQNSAAVAQIEQSFENRHKLTLDTFTTLTREERITCQKWHEENRVKLDQVLGETKENRHYIRGLAHQLNIARAVEEQERKDRQTTDRGARDAG